MSEHHLNPEEVRKSNTEYQNKSKRTIPQPRTYSAQARRETAERIAKRINNLVGLNGKRVLEVGCGLGDLSLVMAEQYGANMVGIDVRELQEWDTIDHPNLTLTRFDFTEDRGRFADNSFDVIVSRAVWEHIRHPYSALEECQRMLSPTGRKYMYANLYRSAIASHLYSRIFFPWPHLLYSPETLAQTLGVRELNWAFWVNKLTYAQYLQYFRQLGFYIVHEKLYTREIDEAFYNEHEKKLGLYPRFDLALDFFEVVLEFDPVHPKHPICDPLYRLGK